MNRIRDWEQLERVMALIGNVAEFVFRLAEISLVLAAFIVFANATDHWGAKLLATTFALAADAWISSRLALAVLRAGRSTFVAGITRTAALIFLAILLANSLVSLTVMMVADVLAKSGVLS